MNLVADGSLILKEQIQKNRHPKRRSTTTKQRSVFKEQIQKKKLYPKRKLSVPLYQ